MQHDHLQKKIILSFWPHPGIKGVLKGKLIDCMMFCFIAINFMTTFRKRKKWPVDPTPGVKGVYKGKLFVSMSLYASLPLIWYATWPYSEKGWFLTSVRSVDRSLTFKILLDLYHTYCSSVCMQISVKILTTEFLWTIKLYDLWPPPKGSRGWVIFWHCCAYLQTLGNHGP